MRYIRIMHFLFVSTLAISDLVVTSAFSHILPSSIYVVSNLAFLGIILLIQNDSNNESILKAALLALWMDINHINTFPIFFVSYVVTVAVMRLWQRQITSTFMEFSIIALVSIFLKESIQFILITRALDMNVTYINYLSFRMMPSIIVNILLVYPLLVFYKKIHHVILNQTQN